MKKDKKYHVTTTGKVYECRADKKPCPYGGSENHFPTKELAFASIEKQEQNSDTTKVTSKKSSKFNAEDKKAIKKISKAFEDIDYYDYNEFEGTLLDLQSQYYNSSFKFDYEQTYDSEDREEVEFTVVISKDNENLIEMSVRYEEDDYEYVFDSEQIKVKGELKNNYGINDVPEILSNILKGG